MNYNYKDIFELILDEKDFTVGGGSTAALAGAMACGLIGMVANLSKGKKYGFEDSKYEDIVKRLNILKDSLLEGSIKDNEVICSLSSAQFNYQHFL